MIASRIPQKGDYKRPVPGLDSGTRNRLKTLKIHSIFKLQFSTNALVSSTPQSANLQPRLPSQPINAPPTPMLKTASKPKSPKTSKVVFKKRFFLYSDAKIHVFAGPKIAKRMRIEAKIRRSKKSKI